MKLLRQYGAGAAGIFKRDVTLFLSYRVRFLTTLVSGFLTLVLFYYISRLVTIGAFSSPDDYFAYALIGVVIMQVLASTLTTLPLTLRQELVAGTFERMLLSAFGPVAGVCSIAIFPFVLALVFGTFMITVGSAVFGLDMSWSTVPLAIPFALLGAAAFVPFALLLAASAVLFKQAGTGAGFLVTGISLVAGFFFPPELLPSWLQWMSEVQPFTPALEALRHVLVGRPLDDSLWFLAGKIAAFAVVLLPVAFLALRSSINLAQRRGTIIEY